MNRGDLSDLATFVAIARARSFSRAAAQLGVTSSALSHRMKAPEERLGIRLLNRTTRNVTPTEAGKRLLEPVSAKLDGIAADVAALADLRDRPAGTIRINADEVATQLILWPTLRQFVGDYPDVSVEVVVDNGFSNIVEDEVDAGVRLGGVVEKDMIAVPISPPLRMVAVASPKYLKARGLPDNPDALIGHDCINYRFNSTGALYAWEFEVGGKEMTVRVNGQLTFNSVFPVLQAACEGLGIGYVLDIHAQPYLERGELTAVLGRFSPPFSGYHLYYTSRRQPTLAFSELVKALRYRA